MPVSDKKPAAIEPLKEQISTPLRGGTIRTAEEKLKQTPPSVQLETTGTNVAEARQSDWANQSILLAIEGNKPWLTTCKWPSHAATSIRAGIFPPPAARSSGASSVDDRTTREGGWQVDQGERVDIRLSPQPR